MNKARITSPAAMSEEQIKEDIAMTPLERLTLAFKISDFALTLRPCPAESICINVLCSVP